MTKRNLRWVAATCAVVMGLGLPLGAQSKNEKDEKKRQQQLQQALQREARPVVGVINEVQKQNAAAKGSGVPDAQAYTVNPKESDLVKAVGAGQPIDAKGFAWRTDLMKAADKKVYVPYTVTVPADAGGGGPISVYIRVSPKGEAPPPADAKGDRFAFEDFFTVEPKGETGGTLKLMRAFAALPGEYDIYFGFRPKLDAKKQNDPLRVVTWKQSMTLPNFWNGELSTSTVVVTSKVETVQGTVSPEVQRERPYLFGQTEFIPSPDNKFKKTEELAIVFQIYNPTLESGQPNVTVEYSFHQKLPEGEKYFNKTSPQQINGQSLPAGYDVAAMEMLPGGQSVPLASFPAGDYRMEIKITDAPSKKTITRDVLFTVVGA